VTTPGLRERRKEATRAALFEAAMTLAEERGYAHVTVDDICAAADVSPRTFFRYFPTKDDVLLTPVNELLDDVLADLRGRPAGEGAWDALVAVVTGLAERIAADRDRSVRSWRVLQDSPEPLATNARGFMEWEAAMSRAVAERLRRRPDDVRARVLTGAALTAFRVSFDHWAARDGRGSLVRTLREALDVIAAGQG
jgi:AcrR family transcriptional regulator